MNIRVKSGLRISDQGMVFDPSSGETFTLNDTGRTILRLLAAGAGEEEVFTELNREFELTRDEFDRRFLDFVSVLRSFNLLEEDA